MPKFDNLKTVKLLESQYTVTIIGNFRIVQKNAEKVYNIRCMSWHHAFKKARVCSCHQFPIHFLTNS